jgi:nitronate monooxygenase
VHLNIYQTLIEKNENDTSLNLQSLLSGFGLQVRALRNNIMLKVEEIEAKGGDLTDLLPLISGERAKKVWKEGAVNEAMLTIGQSVGLIKDIPSVAELVERIIAEAKVAVKRSAAMLDI